MKKLILALLLFFAVSTNTWAQTEKATDTQSSKFWYYPSQDVYLNEATGNYWYYDKTGIKWLEVKSLPTTYDMNTNTDRYEIIYKGNDVWSQNAEHKTKYKIKKDGTVKEK